MSYKKAIETAQSSLIALQGASINGTLSLLKSDNFNTIQINAMISLMTKATDEIQKINQWLLTAKRVGDAQQATIRNLRSLVQQPTADIAGLVKDIQQVHFMLLSLS